jgi:ADP-ribosyl-[dinitrogen reductase] hydrolase
MLARDRFHGALLGLAIGDSVGAAVEFQPRGTFPPVTGMTGGGPFHLKPGQWTDDTSMALCLAESLLACQGTNLKDQAERYVRWYRHGHWSSTGRCFDIGNATRAAIERFESTANPASGSTDPHSAGNGSIMRLAPAVLYYASHRESAIHAAIESSRTTHQAQACLDACAQLAAILHSLLNAEKPALAHRDRDQVKGSGYVLESLEAAIWAFDSTESYEQAILAATNLGDDADTTAAITGQMAGAWYGASGIPLEWRQRCHRGDEILSLADQLYEVAIKP